jgi:hypothetical protein
MKNVEKRITDLERLLFKEDDYISGHPIFDIKTKDFVPELQNYTRIKNALLSNPNMTIGEFIKKRDSIRNFGNKSYSVLKKYILQRI